MKDDNTFRGAQISYRGAFTFGIIFFLSLLAAFIISAKDVIEKNESYFQSEEGKVMLSGILRLSAGDVLVMNDGTICTIRKPANGAKLPKDYTLLFGGEMCIKGPIHVVSLAPNVTKLIPKAHQEYESHINCLLIGKYANANESGWYCGDLSLR